MASRQTAPAVTQLQSVSECRSASLTSVTNVSVKLNANLQHKSLSIRGAEKCVQLAASRQSAISWPILLGHSRCTSKKNWMTKSIVRG